MKEVYDNVYKRLKTYNQKMGDKFVFFREQMLEYDVDDNIIDIGCGKGHYSRELRDLGFNNVLGVEFSEVCCNQFLTDIPHVNADFLVHSKTLSDNQYDLCLCMDVLEHIEPKNIDNMISEISRVGKSAILGIANHSDKINGVELHLIRQDAAWWKAKLEPHYGKVEQVFEANYHADHPIFFVFRCVK